MHQTLATVANLDGLAILERRLGTQHVRQRLAVERDHEAQIFGQGLNFFHIENSYSVPHDYPHAPQGGGPLRARRSQRRQGCH